MSLESIENASLGELKTSRLTLIAEIVEGQIPLADVAARYVQARLDSKMRDEKLAIQGAMMTQLEQRVGALQADADAGALLRQALAETLADMRTMQGHLVALEREASRHQQVLTGAYKLLGDALYAQQLAHVGQSAAGQAQEA